jgi:hypothetical protein
MRQLGVNYRTMWLIHNKIIPAWCEREEDYQLRAKKGTGRCCLSWRGTQWWKGWAWI